MTRVSANEVVGFVAERHGMTRSEMLTRTRCPSYARPRQIAMYSIRQLCPHLSYPAIAKVMERKDHTTILHGVRQIESLLTIHERVTREVSATLCHFRSEQVSA